MEDKVKFIIVGLAVLLATSLFFNLQTYVSKRAVEQERNELKNRNIELSEEIQAVRSESERLKGNIESLSSELNKINQDKQNLEQKIALLDKERASLAEELSKRRAEAQKEAPVTDDTYWAKILREKTELELKVESMLKELRTLKMEHSQLEKEKDFASMELKDLASEKESLENELNYHRKILDNMVAELVQEKNAKRKYQEVVKPTQQENRNLKRQLKALTSRNSRLEKKILTLQEDKNEVERKFNEMSLLLEYRLSQVNDLKQQMESIKSSAYVGTKPQEEGKEVVELPPIVVRPQAGMVDENSPYLAKILAINEENDFVIIDVGDAAGVKVGDTFNVYRGPASVGTIKVIQVRKSIAACDIKREIMPMKVGDVIR